MKRSLFAIRVAIAAGIDLVLFRIRRAFGRLARDGGPLWTQEEATAKARAVGYHGPIDPAGQWLEALSAGRIDHDGNPREPRAT